MAELYGKETGLVKGKGGSMHLFDVERGLMGGYGIVGGHIPLGVGIAYAMRYQETDHITQLYLGDGAMSQGAFHEAANLAGLWGRDGQCPCLFIVENNKYGMGTSVERTTWPPSSTPTASRTRRWTAWMSRPLSRSPRGWPSR
jgi:pyruvate dehydrogenase E1 component alpha subunit